MQDSAISWTDHTFNPWIGCTKVSPACDHCYAERLMDTRMHKVQWGGPRVRTSAANWKLPLRWNAQAEREGRRYRVFCASLADVFDNQVPTEWREDLFEMIRVTPHLDWLLLTKRPQNIIRMVREQGSIAGNGTRYLPDNISLGTTAEDQTRADQNLPALLRTRGELGARVLFVSIEPMLGPVEVFSTMTGELLHTSGNDYEPGSIDWVICGGESGPQARPMHPDWARSLAQQCAAAGVAFHFKQHGEWAPGSGDFGGGKFKTACVARDGRVVMGGYDRNDYPPGATSADGWAFVHHAGTKAAGRLLDGITHDGFPEPARSST